MISVAQFGKTHVLVFQGLQVALVLRTRAVFFFKLHSKSCYYLILPNGGPFHSISDFRQPEFSTPQYPLKTQREVRPKSAKVK